MLAGSEVKTCDQGYRSLIVTMSSKSPWRTYIHESHESTMTRWYNRNKTKPLCVYQPRISFLMNVLIGQIYTICSNLVRPQSGDAHFWSAPVPFNCYLSIFIHDVAARIESRCVVKANASPTYKFAFMALEKLHSHWSSRATFSSPFKRIDTLTRHVLLHLWAYYRWTVPSNQYKKWFFSKEFLHMKYLDEDWIHMASDSRKKQKQPMVTNRNG